MVSVTTPSLPPQGLVYSAMPTAYNTGEPALLPFVGFFYLFCFSVYFCDFLKNIFIEVISSFLDSQLDMLMKHMLVLKKLYNTH